MENRPMGRGDRAMLDAYKELTPVIYGECRNFTELLRIYEV